MMNMFRIAGILLILSWISWTAAPAVAGLQYPASHCRTCNSGYCPMTQAPKHSCHATTAASKCNMRSACDHSRDIAIISFDVLLPELSSVRAETHNSFCWDESTSLVPVPIGIDSPPPRVSIS